MKIKILLLLISVLFTAVSCTQDKQTSDKQTEIVDTTSIAEEDFETFLQNFNSKPTFQRRRVIFPIETMTLDPSEEGMEIITEEITYQEWTLLDFSYDSTYLTRQMDSYKQNIRVYSDSCIIEHRGIDNGIYANYYFVKKDGKWYLKSFSDVYF